MSDTIRCPDHPNGQLVEDYRAGDIICRECGLVVGDRVIDVTSEWRTFANDSDSKDRSRVGDAQSNLQKRLFEFVKYGSNSSKIQRPFGVYNKNTKNTSKLAFFMS